MLPQAFKRASFIITCFLALCSMALAQTAPPGDTPADTLRIVVFGDSLTAGYGLDRPDQNSFPAQLESALQAQGYAVEVINAGVSGDTTAGGLARLDWNLADGGELWIVALGANDGLRGLDPDQAGDNLDRIVARLRAEDIRVILAGVPAPANLGQDYLDRAEAAFNRVAETHDVPLIPNFLEGVWGVKALNQDDYLHPNPQGVAVVVQNVLPTVKAELDALRDGGSL